MVSSYEGEFQFPMSTTTQDDVIDVVLSQMNTPFGIALLGESTRIFKVFHHYCNGNYGELAGQCVYVDFSINREEN